jgi:hypothetical protein
MKSLTSPSKEFWITNISKKAINLVDLGVYIYPRTSINLLDAKHYRHLTEEQVKQSATTGSLKAKSRFISVRQVAPIITQIGNTTLMDLERDTVFPSRPRSAIQTEKVHYDELNISDDEYANENAEIAEEDHAGKWRK